MELRRNVVREFREMHVRDLISLLCSRSSLTNNMHLNCKAARDTNTALRTGDPEELLVQKQLRRIECPS